MDSATIALWTDPFPIEGMPDCVCVFCFCLFFKYYYYYYLILFYFVFLYFPFFWHGFYGPFKNISLISSWSFIKDGRKPENPGKNHLTICMQNLDFPHVTQTRLEPQRWETWWIRSQFSYPLGYGGPRISVYNAYSVDPDQAPRSAASGLGLHCLPMFLSLDTRHNWVRKNNYL